MLFWNLVLGTKQIAGQQIAGQMQNDRMPVTKLNKVAALIFFITFIVIHLYWYNV